MSIEVNEYLQAYLDNLSIDYAIDPTLLFVGALGAYNPPADRLVMSPGLGLDWKFNLVLAHEIIHSTGHPDRLDRGIIAYGYHNPDATYDYDSGIPDELILEELTAFIGAGMLAKDLGFASDETKHELAATIGKLCERAANDCRHLFELAERQAREARDYVLKQSEWNPDSPGSNYPNPEWDDIMGHAFVHPIPPALKG